MRTVQDYHDDARPLTLDYLVRRVNSYAKSRGNSYGLRTGVGVVISFISLLLTYETTFPSWGEVITAALIAYTAWCMGAGGGVSVVLDAVNEWVQLDRRAQEKTEEI